MKKWSKKDANNIIKLIDEASGSIQDRIKNAAKQSGRSYNSCYYVYYKRRNKSKSRKIAKRAVTKSVASDIVHSGMRFQFPIKKMFIQNNQLVIILI